jgi:hypothetical protein
MVGSCFDVTAMIRCAGLLQRYYIGVARLRQMSLAVTVSYSDFGRGPGI